MRQRRQRRGRLAGHVDAGAGADAEALQILVEVRRAFELLGLDGADVQGVLQDLSHRHHAVRASVPVMDRISTDDRRSGFVEPVVGRDGVVVDRARERGNLHDRARLVKVGDDRVAEERGVRARELVGVVTRHVGPGDDASGGGLHDDQRAAFRLIFLDAVREGAFCLHLDGAVE